ncbi:MAG: hypothetical protein V2I30_03405 [Erythrobacter sp.]|nr:hypothetical protein [Erythrobacter sp.]
MVACVAATTSTTTASGRPSSRQWHGELTVEKGGSDFAESGVRAEDPLVGRNRDFERIETCRATDEEGGSLAGWDIEAHHVALFAKVDCCFFAGELP